MELGQRGRSQQLRGVDQRAESWVSMDGSENSVTAKMFYQRGVRGQGSSGTIQQLSESPLDVDAVTQSGDAQLHVVLLGEGGEVGAFDLVLLEALAVFGQAQTLQPITNVVFIPQAEGPLPPRPQGQQGPAEHRGGAGGGVG